MGRGKALTESEVTEIRLLSELEWSASKIAKQIGRSTHVVSNCIELGENYGKKYEGENKRKVTERDQRQIVKLATEKKYCEGHSS